MKSLAIKFPSLFSHMCNLLIIVIRNDKLLIDSFISNVKRNGISQLELYSTFI